MSVRGEIRLWREEPLRRVAAEARLTRPRRLRQFHSFGTGSILHRPLWLYGTQHASIGHHTLFMHGAWLAVERTAWDRPEPALVIGDRVTSRPFLAISASRSVVIEDGVTLGAGCGIYDNNHSLAEAGGSVLDTPLREGSVHIGAGSWLGDRVIVLSGARIGRGCVIGAGAVVRGEIPDNSTAVGVPARVVGTATKDTR